LEDHAYIASACEQLVDSLGANQNLPCSRRFQPGDKTQKRRLTRPGRSNHSKAFSILNDES
jgi:hypothetical protein